MPTGLSISGTGLPSADMLKFKSQLRQGSSIDINFSELLKQYNANNIDTTTGSSGSNILSVIFNIITQSIQGTLFSVVNQDSQVNQSSQVVDSNTVDTDAINKTKQALSSDLALYKTKGITVSDWDTNNSCTLSVNGKTATITIDNSGNLQFSGDMEEIAEYIKENDSNEKTSVDKQNEFIKAQEAASDPVVGDVKSTTIKVDGKDVAVNEYTTQSGKKYYLDGSGNKVTPD